MKICIVAQTFAPQEEGGAEISSRHVARNLADRHDIVVLSLGQEGSSTVGIGEMASNQPYRVHRIRFNNSYLPGARRPQVGVAGRLLWHTRNAIGAVAHADLRQFFQAESFDLIYAQNSARFQPALYDVAAELGIPVCQHLRDYALLCPRTSMYRDGRNCDTICTACRLLTTRARTASRSVGTVIAVSDFVRQRFLQHGMFADAAFHVLHNTNTARADFDSGLIAARPPPGKVFTFGYLGALSTEKGVTQLVDAFLSLPMDLPVRLVLAGRGHPDFTAALQARTAHLPAGRLEWLGHVRPETVFVESEAVLVPSLWHEPQSRVLVEAATYGVPVIAARTGGTPEIVEGHGTGWCHDPDDVQALAALLRDAAEGGPAAWRARLPGLFSGLARFKGTAEDTNYYERLEGLLLAAAR